MREKTIGRSNAASGDDELWEINGNRTTIGYFGMRCVLLQRDAYQRTRKHAVNHVTWEPLLIQWYIYNVFCVAHDGRTANNACSESTKTTDEISGSSFFFILWIRSIRRFAATQWIIRCGHAVRTHIDVFCAYNIWNAFSGTRRNGDVAEDLRWVRGVASVLTLFESAELCVPV